MEVKEELKELEFDGNTTYIEKELFELFGPNTFEFLASLAGENGVHFCDNIKIV